MSSSPRLMQSRIRAGEPVSFREESSEGDDLDEAVLDVVWRE